MTVETAKYGARAGRDLLKALRGASLLKSYEHVAAVVREAGGDSSDTKVCMQQAGERTMTLDEAFAIASDAGPSWFVGWVSKRLGVGEDPRLVAGLRESIRGTRRTMARVLERMEDAVDPEGDAGEECSPSEARELLEELREHKVRVEQVERALEARLRLQRAS